MLPWQTKILDNQLDQDPHTLPGLFLERKKGKQNNNKNKTDKQQTKTKNCWLVQATVFWGLSDIIVLPSH